jgi:hypothetical protein
MHDSSPKQLQKGSERRTHSDIREPVTSIEHAMDIAIGDEGKPWVERRKAA